MACYRRRKFHQASSLLLLLFVWYSWILIWIVVALAHQKTDLKIKQFLKDCEVVQLFIPSHIICRFLLYLIEKQLIFNWIRLNIFNNTLVSRCFTQFIYWSHNFYLDSSCNCTSLAYHQEETWEYETFKNWPNIHSQTNTNSRLVRCWEICKKLTHYLCKAWKALGEK